MNIDRIEFRQRMSGFIGLAPLALTIFLGKIGLPIFGAIGLSIALPMILLIMIGGLIAGTFQVNFIRLCLYLALTSWASIAQLFGKNFSFSSLAFLFLIYLPYVFELKNYKFPKWIEKASPQDVFTNLGLSLAFIGIYQYLMQLLVGATYAFPIEHFIPQNLLIKGFNYLNPTYYGSTTYKSNGIFFLEPSFFSQYLAVSLLIEISNKNRLARIIIHLLALGCTYSGTGLIVLATGGLTLIIARRRWDLIAIGLTVMSFYFVFGETLGLSIFENRLAEFSSPGTSGFERFVAWTYMLQDQFWEYSSRVWSGMGAGAFEQQQKIARYTTFGSPFIKIPIEFGLPGAFLYFSFVVYCIVGNKAPVAIKAGLIACTMMNGAYSETNAGILLTLLLWPRIQVTFESLKNQETSNIRRKFSLL